MQVYIELAIAENFCMDFTLLCAAKAAVKNRAAYARIAAGAALGACFAVVIPLFDFGAVAAIAMKLVSGLFICLVAGRYDSFKSYLKFAGAFLAVTALVGGALLGVFALAGLDFAAGQGYILSSVPIGIPLFAALIICIAVKRLAARLSKGAKKQVTCRIYAGQSHVELGGFYDSGNRVYIRGEPVSVIPADSAEKLDGVRIKDEVKIHTVAGSKNMGVFTADKVEIVADDKVKTYYGLKIGVSPRRIDCAVLHPDILEE